MSNEGKREEDDARRKFGRFSLPLTNFSSEKRLNEGVNRHSSSVPSSQNMLPTLTEKLIEHNKEFQAPSYSVSAPGSSRRTPVRSRSRNSRSSGRYSLTPTRNRENQKRELRERQSVRRRRSSMIVMEDGNPGFDPNYVGPITLDYLRFFCRVSVDAKKKSVPSSRADLESGNSVQFSVKKSDSPRRIAVYSPTPNHGDKADIDSKQNSPKVDQVGLRNEGDFDDSFPLPLDNLNDYSEEKSAYHEQNENYPMDVDMDEGPARVERSYPELTETKEPKAFSYLERILLARKSQNRSHEISSDVRQPVPDRIDDPETEENILLLSEKESNLIIEDRTVPDSDALKSNLENSNVNSILENDAPIQDNITPQMDISVGMDGVDDYLSQNIVGEMVENLDLEHIEQADADQVAVEAYTPEEQELQSGTPSHLGSPPIITQDYVYDNGDTNDFFDDPISSSSISGILDNVSRVQSEDVDSQALTRNARVPKARGGSKLRKSISSKNELPVSLIKKITKSVRLKSNGDSGTLGFNHKTKNYPPNVYEFLQKSSDRFLQSMVSDLEAYASHRSGDKSSQINMKDVMLYLKRIKFCGTEVNREKEIDSISKLAQQFLPLELLIELHDSLNTKKNVSVFKKSHDLYSDEDE